jgi:serine-type D-Ala-D-Ala endopeptidase (penicillin-binding protein 7)
MLRKIALVCALSVGIATVPAKADGTDKKPQRITKARTVAHKPGTPDLGQDGGPNLLSHAALVFDQATGRQLYAKNADTVTPIASITKLMTAMVVLDAKLALDEPITIESQDKDTVKGSRSRLPVGTAFQREDLLRLALMASDNRAAMALGRSYPGGSEAFVAAMNAKAKLLGLASTRFVDPSGLAAGNVSSPQDLATLVSEASHYERIREFSTTLGLNVKLPNSKRQIGFNNTNALVKNADWNIGLSKTGYISESGKCLVMQAMIANQPIVIVLLDSWGKLTRLGDANRIKRWIENSKVAAVSGSAS